MGKIPRWACTSCGMSSSRGDSVRRHVRNVEKGWGKVVPFSSYVAGINVGVYVPRPPPTFGRNSLGTLPKNPITEEFQREFAKEAVKQIFHGENSNQTLGQWSQISAMSQWQSFLSNLQVFGYRVYVCDKCQTKKPRYVCFPSKQNKTSKLVVDPAGCVPGASMSEKKFLQEHAETQLGLYLESIIRSGFVRPRIKAVRVSRTSDARVIIKNDADPSKAIFFNSENEYAYSYYIPESDDAPYTYTEALKGNLYDARRTIVRSRWLERAAHNSETVLDDKEIADAAAFFHNATFGFVRMSTLESNTSISSYSRFFVYITSSPPEDPSKTKSSGPNNPEIMRSNSLLR